MNQAVPAARMSWLERTASFIKSDAARLIYCSVGVVGTLLLYSVMQEKIMKGTYGEAKEVFKFALFLVLCNRVLTACIVCAIILILRKPIAPVAPLYNYGAISISNVVATTCQYEALRHVSMAVQTLAKCAKMMPVMIWSTFIMQKRYGCKDYSLALLVTAGCTVFLLAANTKQHREVEDSFWGAATMLGYLGFDGFTSTFQDKLFKSYNMETYNQILYVTLWSCVFSAIGLLGSGQWFLAVEFVVRHPACLLDIILLSMAATAAQFFISYTIKTFGALVFAIIMTTRQLFTILLSCAVFGHSINPGQWGGMVLVFGSLYYKSYAGKGKRAAAVGSKSGDAEVDTESSKALLMDDRSSSSTAEEDPSNVVKSPRAIN